MLQFSQRPVLARCTLRRLIDADTKSRLLLLCGPPIKALRVGGGSVARVGQKNFFRQSLNFSCDCQQPKMKKLYLLNEKWNSFRPAT